MRYILLCRHGQHRDGKLIKKVLEDHTSEYPCDVVGKKLSEQLAVSRGGRDAMTVSSLFCSEEPEACESLERILTTLGASGIVDETGAFTNDKGLDISITKLPELNPSVTLDREAVEDLTNKLRSATKDGPNTALVVGHQPLLSRLADSLLRPAHPWRRPRHAPVPLDHAGIVCVGLSDDKPSASWLIWAISYDDSDAADKVRQKIERKMESAKLLGALITVGLSVLFGVLFDQAKVDSLGARGWAVQTAGALFLLAAVLYLATMYAYDTLLMPQRFWGERRATKRDHPSRRRWLVERPPSSAAWILYQNMMRIWNTRFTVASVLMVAGTALLGYAALDVNFRLVLLAGPPVMALLLWWLWWSQPVLGSED
jgi:hypothetical protein